MIIPNRKYIHSHDGEVTELETEMSWSELRRLRNAALSETDWWGVKDLIMSQAKKDYRIFLRDLPQNYESANAAADAWDAYELPE
jgi:hypothetical protein|tara:strand:+ start:3452 stop:3706 length:255 start_codon:yes stop_codon:yes gene_type:complete